MEVIMLSIIGKSLGRVLLFSAIMLSLTFTSACTPAKKIRRIEIKFDGSIKTVSVCNKIEFTGKGFEVQNVRNTMRGCYIAGPCGVMVGSKSDEKRNSTIKEEILKVVKPKEILENVLYDEFVRALKECKSITFIDNPNDSKAEGEFVLVIRRYGLRMCCQCQSSGEKYSPIIGVDVYLVKNPPFKYQIEDFKLKLDDPEKNPILFSDYIWFDGCMGNMVALHPIDTFIQNPEDFKAAFTKATKLASIGLLKDF
jgi:hypothetical protein